MNTDSDLGVWFPPRPLEGGTPTRRVGGAFAISLWVCPLEMKAGGVLGGGFGKGFWELELTKDGKLKWGGAIVTETAADRVGVGCWYHVVISGDAVGRWGAIANRVCAYVGGNVALCYRVRVLRVVCGTLTLNAGRYASDTQRSTLAIAYGYRTPRP